MSTAESFEQLRHDLRRLRNSVLRQARKDLRTLKQGFERKTGVVFGRLTVDGYSPNGYPLRHLWLTVAPRRDGYAFAVTVKRHGVYVDYVPKHEEVSA